MAFDTPFKDAVKKNCEKVASGPVSTSEPGTGGLPSGARTPLQQVFRDNHVKNVPKPTGKVDAHQIG